MGKDKNNQILAILAKKSLADNIKSGVPAFLFDTDKEIEEVAPLLARILSAMVHDLKNGIFIIVRH